MHIERVEFSDGWWDIKTILTRGMRKQLNKAAMKEIPYDLLAKDGINTDDAEAVKTALLARRFEIDTHIVDDTMLLIGTQAYSFSETVDMGTIDSLPDSYVQQVLDRMKELYLSLNREKMADFFVRR